MSNFNDRLTALLKKDPNFLDGENNLLKNEVVNKAWKADQNLIGLLIEDEEIKAKFFSKIKDCYVFDINTFTDYIQDKHFLNDSYTKYKNKIGLNIDGKFLNERKEISLVWPYKDCVLEGGQSKEDQKRKEIFFNEILAQDEIDRLLDPKVLTNFKRYIVDGEQKVTKLKRDEKGTIKENLIIKGNNLLALHSLKKQFQGKVKLIYIDPPYNTGSDSFGYNDNFNHAAWLTFMKNRLKVARDLLRDDGVIFIQINDIEQAHLKVICDEVFGRDNFHTTICVQMSHLSGVKMAHKEVKLPKIKEFILFYTKTEKIKLNPQYSPTSWDKALDRYKSFINKNGYEDEDCNKWEVITLTQAIQNKGIDIKNQKAVFNFKIENADLIFRTSVNRGADYSKYPKDKFSRIINPDNSYYFIYKNEDVNFAADKIMEVRGIKTPVVALGDIWTDIGINNLSNEGGVDLRFGKKPENLIERIIKLCTEKNDVILDYHIGSGTTCAVAHKMDRQYIGIEQLDYGENDCVVRLQNVIGKKNKKDGQLIELLEYDQSGISKAVNWQGGGEFVCCELAKYNQTFIDQIQDAKNTDELLKIWKAMKEKSFLNYNVDIKKQDKNIEEFKTFSLNQQKQILVEMLNKNQLYVNLSEIEDAEFKISDEDKKLNKAFYGEGI